VRGASARAQRRRAAPRPPKRAGSRAGAYLRDLDLCHEALPQVLQDDAVRGGEKGQYVADEVPLVVVQRLPVRCVAAEVDLLGCSRAGLLLAPHASGQRPGLPVCCLHRRRRPQHAAVLPLAQANIARWAQRAWSAPVQKLASAFLYISHTSLYLIGNMQKRSGFSVSSGSAIWPTIACVAHQSKCGLLTPESQTGWLQAGTGGWQQVVGALTA